jgi:hypothetical protein
VAVLHCERVEEEEEEAEAEEEGEEGEGEGGTMMATASSLIPSTGSTATLIL